MAEDVLNIDVICQLKLRLKCMGLGALAVKAVEVTRSGSWVLARTI